MVWKAPRTMPNGLSSPMRLLSVKSASDATTHAMSARPPLDCLLPESADLGCRPEPLRGMLA